MASVLVYVDDSVARQMATGLIGSEVRLTNKESSAVGVNFRVLVRRDRGHEQSTATRIADLLPEMVADALQQAVPNRVADLGAFRTKFMAGSEDAFRPGTPVLIENAKLTSGGKDASAVLSGEPCIRYNLYNGDFFVHAYVPLSAETVFDSLIAQPVEVLGLLRYTPAYQIPGARSANLGLRVTAVWIR